MALQVIDAIREEEGGRISWQWRILTSALDLHVKSGRHHGILMIFVQHLRPETGAVEFDEVKGWLGLPRVFGTQLRWIRS